MPTKIYLWSTSIIRVYIQKVVQYTCTLYTVQYSYSYYYYLNYCTFTWLTVTRNTCVWTVKGSLQRTETTILKTWMVQSWVEPAQLHIRGCCKEEPAVPRGWHVAPAWLVRCTRMAGMLHQHSGHRHQPAQLLQYPKMQMQLQCFPVLWESLR